jgi:hypothetical protein
VDVIQKFQKSKGRSKRTHTWRWVGLVWRTKRARPNCPNEDYAQCRTNTRETVAWLQKGEAPRFAHLPPLSLSLLLTSLWTLLYLWTMDGTHTLYVSSLPFLIGSISFLLLFVHVKTWYRHTLSQCGVKCTMLRNTKKTTLKGQGHQKKRCFARRRKSGRTSLGRL